MWLEDTRAWAKPSVGKVGGQGRVSEDQRNTWGPGTRCRGVTLQVAVAAALGSLPGTVLGRKLSRKGSSSSTAVPE